MCLPNEWLDLSFQSIAKIDIHTRASIRFPLFGSTETVANHMSQTNYAKLMLLASPDSPADSNNRKSLAHSKIRDCRIRMINPECARLPASGMKLSRLQVMTTNALALA